MFEKLLKMKSSKVLSDLRRDVEPDDSYTQAMLDFRQYHIEGVGTREAIYAFEMSKDKIRKELVEALLLSNADLAEVEEVFGIPPSVMKLYAELFFDTGNFYTKLDVVSYLENYKDDFGKAVKIRAVNIGPEFLYFKYANIVPRTESQKILIKKMFMGSAYRAMEANYSTLTASTSKASVAHAKIMMKSYEAIQRLMDENTSGNDDLVKVLTAADKAEGLKSEPGKKMFPSEGDLI